MTISHDLRHQLTTILVDRGFIRTQAWADAFRSVPREAFVRQFSVPNPPGRHQSWDLNDPSQKEDALRAVYTDTSLLTQQTEEGAVTSASTAPSLMAMMLEELDVKDGMKVLEIGTGTGYNAALLSHRVGGENVTSIDLDPSLVEAARRAMFSTSYTPFLLAGNGLTGYVPRAPYDRLIATCGVERIPATWVRQVRPGGVIVANVGFGVVRLTVYQDGSATGPFVDYASFMLARSDTQYIPPGGRKILDLARGDSTSRVVSAFLWPFLDERAMTFLRSVMMPGVEWVSLLRDSGPEHVLVDPASGSWVRALQHGSDVRLKEAGPRRLWSELDVCVQSWLRHGRPNLTSYGLKVLPDGQNEVFLDDHYDNRLPVAS